MDILRTARARSGFLNGHFLLAMPGMHDSDFERCVVYICAHSDDGAMGFIINRPQPVGFPEVLQQVGIINDADTIILPDAARHLMVRSGGPVDRTRGFILHSDDYMGHSTMPVSDEICLTATIDILRAISGGEGPRQLLMTLGYAGWSSGQLEQEIANNDWLTCPASNDMLFDSDMSGKYGRLMAKIGVDIARLVSTAGNA